MVDRITVRMYSMGFGDCFLVTFWSGQDPKRVLFDCGSLTRTKSQVAKVAQDVVRTCSSANGAPKIDLVVCTHRHKDHVCGFDNPIWKSVEVSEVWMPWTENPSDPEATRIRNRQSAFALALCKAIAPNADVNETLLAKRSSGSIENAQLALAVNSLTNEQAMSTLHRGFAGGPSRRFLPEKSNDQTKGDNPAIRSLENVPGVRFYILGPSRDEAVIANMDPPPGAAYLAQPTLETSDKQSSCGCEPMWQVEEAEFRDKVEGWTTFNDEDKKKVDEIADDPEFGELAAAIDNAVNNTSLMIMIEVGDQFLLFPGDAQWGTWKAVLDQTELRQLLSRTTLLKVSHHGSHNGTPRELIDMLIGDNVTAFVSTGTVKQWPGIPRLPLVDALAKKTSLARSDVDSTQVPTKFKVERDLYVEWTTNV